MMQESLFFDFQQLWVSLQLGKDEFWWVFIAVQRDQNFRAFEKVITSLLGQRFMFII